MDAESVVEPVMRDPESTPDTPPAGPKAAAGRLVARRGREAVNVTEHLICGAGAVRSPAVAEGLALAGHRAATLLGADGRPPASAAAATAPWVEHRIRGEQPAACHPAGFELVAATVQDAVDHCLVAHRLAAELRLPGICTVDRRTAEEVQLVTIPSPEICHDLLGKANGGAPEPAATAPEAIAEVVRVACAAVSARTGRPCLVIALEEVEEAEYLLVTAGAAAEATRQVAAGLRAAGVACGLVVVGLLRPFPQRELGKVFAGRKKIAVVEAAAPAGQDLPLATEVRQALAAGKRDKVCAVPFVDGDEQDLAARVRSAFGLSAPEQAAAVEPVLRAEDRLVLGAVPAGSWTEGLLLDVAAWLGRLDALWLHRPGPELTRAATLVVGRGVPDRSPPASLDLLFVGNPSLLAVEGPARLVRKGGTVVLAAPAESAAALWRNLSPAQRELITSRELQLRWVDAGALGAGGDGTRTVVCGALLASGGALQEWAGDRELVAAVVARGEAAEAELLRTGAAAIHAVPPAEVAAAEADFRPSRRLPHLPAAGDEEPSAEWREALHQFHLSGRGGESAAQPFPALPLPPAAMEPLGAGAGREYPLVVPGVDLSQEDAAEPSAAGLSALVEEALGGLAALGSDLPVVRDHVDRLARAARWVVQARRDHAPVAAVLDDALATFAREFELSEAGTAALEEEIRLLRPRLPATGTIFGLGERTLLPLYATAVHQDRGRRREAFGREVKTLIDGLRDLLQIDAARGAEGRSEGALSATFGDGGSFIDLSALAASLPEQRGTRPQGAERRERIERTLAILERYLEEVPQAAELTLVHPGVLPPDLDLPSARVVEHPDSLGVAVGLFDGSVEQLVEVLRAVRVARLEVREAYNPELHDAMLARFDSQGFTADELLLVPPVAVLETSERLQGPLLGTFSEILLSGRPLQILVTETADGKRRESWEALSGYHPGLGYVAVAHREAFVVQSTLARPLHLLAGFRAMARAVRPAVAVVAVPDWSAPISPLLQAVAAHAGRATPCFRYDPEAGITWAERFDLGANPEPERAWPVHEVAWRDDADAEGTLSEAFTFAHFAALDPAYRAHLRVIPRSAWSEEQVEVAAYLAAPAVERPKLLPFIWVVDDQGDLARAVTTRELAFACHDRMRAWRILQELAGTDNEYARRAAEAARREALAEAEQKQQEMAAAHAAELEEVRQGAASQAMEQLAAFLLDFGTAPALPAAVPAVAPPPAAPPPVVEAKPEVAEAPPAEEEEEEEAVSFDEPYIESELCTTCNDCTALNPSLFKYNDNKQAYVADPAAGTFQQLVTAAEKCPARCIHPGLPRDGDDTVTDELIAKAARFN